MNKPTSTYKMSKPLKMLLASATMRFKNKHDLGAWKRSWIDAEIEANKKPKMSKEDKE